MDPHERRSTRWAMDSEGKIMMTPHLQQRFEQLLRFAKDPQYCVTAHQNVAAAKELVETLYSVDLLTHAEYNEYRGLWLIAKLEVSAAEDKRVADALQMSRNAWDGSRTDDTVSVRGQQVEVSEFLRKPA